MKKGFTLIELLTVVSIMALLSSSTLATVKVTKEKAVDSLIKEVLRSVQTQIEIYNTSNNTSNYGAATTNAARGHRCLTDVTTDYGPQQNTNNAFTNDPKAASLIAKAVRLSLVSTNSFPPDWFNEDLSFCYISQSPLTYMISVPLKNVPNTSWCVDNRGHTMTLHTSDLNILFRSLNNGTGVDCTGANF